MSRIKVGIIGYGGSAKVYHLPFILSVPELELHAFLQRSEAPPPTPGSDVPRGQHCTVDFPETFFTDEEIELVVICTGPATHAELALQAINAGKNGEADFAVLRTIAPVPDSY
jgi:predicted dehydrogenase